LSTKKKNISFKINVPEGSPSNGKPTESSGFDRSHNDLDLTTYETQSIEENVEPWKQHGPWYKDVTKRRRFAFSVILALIIIVIIVVPVSVANATKNKNQ